MEAKPWGKSVSINLSGCAHERLTDPNLLEKFVAEVIPRLGLVAHGPCYIDRFGDDDLEGYSAMQFIKTSTITVHLDEVGNRAFIDIFACRDFDPDAAEKFAKKFFQAAGSKVTVLRR